MAGILGTTTSSFANVKGQQAHFAVSSETIANTAAADASRLAANGGDYRAGDIVIASCTNGILIGKVAANGAIAQFFTAA